MATEREAKFRVECHDPVRRAAIAAGGKCVSRVLESNLLMDRPDASLRRKGEALRIRGFTVGEGPERLARLTYKGPAEPGRFKVREEREVDVTDAGAARAILEGLGFVVTIAFEKLRETWQLGGCIVELDQVPHIGQFVEIEGPSDDAIAKTARTLELDADALLQSTYLELLDRYFTEQNCADRCARFNDPAQE